MGALGWLIAFGIVGGTIRKSLKETSEENARIENEEKRKRELVEAERRRKQEDEERRKNTPCIFLESFSKFDFESMAIRVAKRIKRLSVNVEAPIIYGTVKSQSGLSEWHFQVDFNDFGFITGKYWLSADNSDSSVPVCYADSVANQIRDFIRDYCREDYEYEKFDVKRSPDNSQFSWTSGILCPFCGEKNIAVNSIFCSYCGKRLS